MMESDESTHPVKPGSKPGPAVISIGRRMKAGPTRKKPMAVAVRPAITKPAKVGLGETAVPAPPAPGCDAWWNR